VNSEAGLSCGTCHALREEKCVAACSRYIQEYTMNDK
jgi:hypothetical protein